MRKLFRFGVQETMVVTNEAISGFLIDVTSVQADGITLAAIADLQAIGLDIKLRRAAGYEVDITQDYLDSILVGLYAQTVALELIRKPFGLTHKLKVDFMGGNLHLGQGDELVFKLNVPAAAFTLLSTADSAINVETIPAVGGPTGIPVVKVFAIGNGDTNVNLNIGNNVHSIVAALDFTATYTASAKAKFDGINIIAQGFNKDVSKALLELENIHEFDNNPESDVSHLLLFRSNTLIHGVNLKGKLNIPADDKARIIVVAFENV